MKLSEIDSTIRVVETALGEHTEEALHMACRDHAKLREAGFELAEAASRVVRDYDGTHRLSLAIAAWYRAVANQGDRA